MTSPQEIISRAIEVGTEQFYLRKYEEALSLFTKAIAYTQSLDQDEIVRSRVSSGFSARPSYHKDGQQTAHPKLFTLLDRRAATHEKLNQYAGALNDAVKALEIEPFNSKGYIRVGRIYELLKNDKRAYETYSAGIRKIEEGLQLYRLNINASSLESLRERKAVIREKLSKAGSKHKKMPKKRNCSLDDQPHKRTECSGVHDVKAKRVKYSSQSPETNLKIFDPVAHLPIEIVTQIFTQLQFTTVLKCLQVSSLWNDTLSKIPNLFKSIIIKRDATYEDVKNCYTVIDQSRRYCSSKTLDHLQLTSCKRTEEGRILNLIWNKVSLSYIGVLDLNFDNLSMDKIVEYPLQSKRTRLNLEKLRVLKLSCVFVPKYEEILLDLLPNLEVLELTSVSGVLNNINKEYNRVHKQYPKLKKLTVVGKSTNHPIFPFLNLFLRNTNYFPNLSHLCIVGFDLGPINSTNGEYNMLQNLHNIETLIFENNNNFDLQTFLKSHDLLRFPYLRKFALREKKINTIEHLHNYDSLYLTKIFKNLEVLDLTGSSISNQGLSKILKICGTNLKQLSIGYCPNIVFKRGPFRIHVNGGFFNFDDFFQMCPYLDVLYLNQSTDFNDYSMTQMIGAIQHTKTYTNLRLLDLSFNEISPYKLIDLLKVVKIDYLVLHGMYVTNETIKLLEVKYCKKVDSKLDKQSWREYGINSYNPF